MDPTALITGSGVASVVVAVAYVIKLLLENRKGLSRDQIRTNAAIADANTANAMLSNTLIAVQKDNATLRREVAALRRELTLKDVKISELQGRVEQIASELAALKGHV